jgi:hypothetical protein
MSEAASTLLVGGKQYVAIQSGLNRNALNINSITTGSSTVPIF